MTPVHTAFEMQRQSIKQSQQLVEQSLDLQRNGAEAFLRNGLTTQRAILEQSTELAYELTDTQLDAVESTVDENEREIRSAMDEQFEQNAELIQQLLNAQFEQGADLVQHLLNAQFDAFLSALETGESNVRSTIDKQFETVIEFQNDVWDEFESEALTAVTDLSERQKLLLTHSIEAFLNAQQDAEQQMIEDVRHAEETVQPLEQ